MSEKNISYEYDSDYTQSANTLFHFMNKREYLEFILKNKGIVPRYCIEDIEYLNIESNGTKFREAAILQKCFCDIPFHKLTATFELNGVGEEYNSLSSQEKMVISKNNTHPDYYGEYAIAFSKGWGESKNLQPVHYLNYKSKYTTEFSALFTKVLEEDNLPEEYVNDIISRLSFIKPLRGKMKRKNPRNRNFGKYKDIEFYKNFHDEKEWRYIPNSSVLKNLNLDSIIANKRILERIVEINNNLATKEYESAWLKFNYEDIRYIIVPNSQERINIIDTIMNIEDEFFNEEPEIITQKGVLLSKIIVLEEIRKDW